jgi:fucose permease
MGSQKNYRIVLLILVIFFVISFLTNILGALNPSVSSSFMLTETMAGFLPFAFFIAYGIMSIPSGFLLEKYGAKKLMVVAFALSLFGALLFALFPTFGVFLITLFSIGTAMAVLQVVINPLLRIAGGEEHYAFTSVLAQLIFGAASFLSPQVYSSLVFHMGEKASAQGWLIRNLSQLVPSGMAWVSMYWLFAVTSLVMIFVILITALPKVALSATERVGTRESYFDLFKKKAVILYFFGIFAYVGVEQGISYWMSKYLQLYHGYDFETIGANAVGNFWGLMTVGGIVGLLLLKLIDSKIVLKIFTILAMLSLAMALFGSSGMSRVAFMGSGFFLSVMYPILMSLALNSVRMHHGSFTGILMTGIMGGAVVQVMIGAISDRVSLQAGMMLIFVALAYILFIAFWAKPLIRNKTIRL